jgi:hypothetical protein
MIVNHRKYLPSFAEKIDRLTICGLKEIYSANKEQFHQEIDDLLHDIQLDIDEGVVVTADILRAIIILTQSNLAIWQTEDFIRSNVAGMSDEETAAKLTLTHKLNGTRSIAKTMIQNKIGGRVDPKINCLAENSAWDIKW